MEAVWHEPPSQFEAQRARWPGRSKEPQVGTPKPADLWRSDHHDAAAFATDDPFTALGYPEDQFTRSIEKWAARPCQVDDSYLISYETFLEPATDFCDFLASQYGLQVRCEYILPFKIRAKYHYANWKKRVVQYDDLGNPI